MNDALHDALKRTQKPFDGVTLVVRDALPFLQTKEVLLTIATFIVCRWSDEQLLWFEDWHEHDSYRTNEKLFKLERVERWLASPETFVQNLPGDDDVRLAIYPESREFLWRFGVDGYAAFFDGRWHLDTKWNGQKRVPRTQPEWYVDFSAAPDDVQHLREALGSFENAFEMKPAKAFFEQRAAR